MPFVRPLIVFLFCAVTISAAPVSVAVFERADIQFSQTDTLKQTDSAITRLDNGRLITKRVTLPSPESALRITGRLVIEPIPKDELDVFDKWDRAGDVRLRLDGQPDIELVKFITSYGGRSEFTCDLSHLAPLLAGDVTIAAFIDTWVTPAWKVSFSLDFTEDTAVFRPAWSQGLCYIETATAENMADSGATVSVTVPEGLQRVLVYYYVSGHCTDGQEEDEFIPKDNVVRVDGRVVHRFLPWRDDCRQFRTVNPCTRRWSDGSWSSDYSRSGWCPGDWVRPVLIDLTDHLTPGSHVVNIQVENIRPRDKDGHYGYWRIAATLVGYPTKELLKNF